MSRSVSHVGAHFLEREGLRAIAGQEQQESEEQGVALQGSLGHSLRVVSANVDGLGDSYDPLRPPDRMTAILKAVLAQRPTVILLQEVIDSMHRVLLDVLVPPRLGGEEETVYLGRVFCRECCQRACS